MQIRTRVSQLTSQSPSHSFWKICAELHRHATLSNAQRPSLDSIDLFFSTRFHNVGPHGLSFTWWRCCGLRQKSSLPTPSYSVHVSVSILMALSTVFHSINSPDNSLLSHSVLPILILPCWSFQLYNYLFLKVSLSPNIIFWLVDWA